MIQEHFSGREIVRQRAVSKLTGRSRVQIWRDVRARKFPAPVQIGANAIGWFLDEIVAWQSGLPRRTYRSENQS